MRNIKLAVIILSILFLISCQNEGITGLTSYDDYQDLLTKYGNNTSVEQSFSETLEGELEQEQVFQAGIDENETYVLSNNQNENIPFETTAKFNDSCFTAFSD